MTSGELDIWLAQHVFGWEKVWFRACGVRLCSGPFNSQAACQTAEKDSGVPVMRWRYEDGGTSPRHNARWSPTTNPFHFAEIKREIERRGWPWQCHCYLTEVNGQTIKSYSFRIYDTEEHEQYTAHPVLANGVGVTEELAGCRAMKAAVEATNESAC